MLYFYRIGYTQVQAEWNPIKNHVLKLARGVGFEDVLKGRFVKIDKHPKREAQKLYGN
jgi:hypothetical protein